MQTAFFKISGVIDIDTAIDCHQERHQEDLRQEGREGRADEQCRRRCRPRQDLSKSRFPPRSPARRTWPQHVPDDAPQFVKEVTAEIMAGRGDEIPGQQNARGRQIPDRQPPSTKNAISPCIFPSGNRTCASSAASVRWFARTRPSASRPMMPSIWTRRPRHSRAPTPRAKNLPA